MGIYEKAQKQVFDQKLQKIGELAAGIVVAAFVEFDSREKYDNLIADLQAIERSLPEMIDLAKANRKASKAV